MRAQGGPVTTVAISTSAPARIAKGKLGVYFAWGAFTKRDGVPFTDSHGDQIPDDELTGGALSLAKSAQLGHEHDGTITGSVPLVMPLAEDIQAALELTSPHAGLVVGFQPTAEFAAKLDAGEVWQMSIEGVAEVEAVEKATIAKSEGTVEKAEHKRTLRKLRIDKIDLVRAAAHGAGTTIAIAKRKDVTVVDIAKRTPALTTATDGHQHAIHDTDEKDGSTSWDSAMSTPYGGHSHPWVRAADGSISIGEQAGHTHQLVTPSTEIAMSQTPDLAKQLADAQALIAKTAARVVTATNLTADQAAFAKRLKGADLDAFLDAPDAERVAKSTPIYKSAATDEVFFASDDPRLISMAKGYDAQVALNTAQAKDAASAVIAKSAAAIPHVKGRDLLVKAVYGVQLTAEERTQALADLATVDVTISKVCQPLGSGVGGDGASDPQIALEKATDAFAKEKGLDGATAVVAFAKTDEGKRLYAAAYPATR